MIENENENENSNLEDNKIPDENENAQNDEVKEETSNEENVLSEEDKEDEDVSDLSRVELESEVDELKKENDKYYKHLQRTAAEFENYKKRVQKEKDAIYNLAVGDTVVKFVNVLDNIDRALAVETADDKMKEGISLIRKQMLDIMTELGCSEIPTVGETFNPEIHDAVMHIESEEYGEQQIVEELRKGYKCGDRVIRHAMVKVAN
ncbi:MAG: nucleotide exchange factor GrpE [Clostridia bacterium]|nr:nucleotide exchange factor GrpE [Clostridia bacterium]